MTSGFDRARYGTRIQTRAPECVSFDTVLGFETVSGRFTIFPGSRWRLESVRTTRERDALTGWPWPTRLTSSKLGLHRRCPSSAASCRWRHSESRLGAAEDEGWGSARLSGRRICCSHCLAWRAGWLRRRWPQERMTKQNASIRVREILGRTYLCRRCTRTRITSSACHGPQESGRAAHAGGRTLIPLPARAAAHYGVSEPSTSTDERALKSPRTSATTHYFSRTILSLSISLALSWQFGTAAITMVLICASAHGSTSQDVFPANVRIQQWRRKLEEVRCTWRLAPPHVREIEQLRGRQIRQSRICSAISNCKDGRNIVFFIWVRVYGALEARNAPPQ